MDEITPFTIDVSSRSLEDLAWRLQRARWPEHLLVAGGEDAARLRQVRRLLERWQAAFDWRAHERRLNALAQYRVTVDGIGLHVVWVRSGRPDAEPLLLLNGWPSSFIEYEGVIGALTTPSSGRAFDVVIPARPGYGFSDPALARPGSDDAVADLFAHLMSDRLGYGRFLVHGDDFGGSIASRLAWRHPALVQALHVTEWLDPTRPGDATAEEDRYLDALAEWRLAERAYGQVAATRPQTLGLALDDSPLGLLAWIVDKFLSWTEPREDGEPAFEDDLLLATTTLYRVRERGGHFLAAESPDAFVDELRAFFDSVAATS